MCGTGAMVGLRFRFDVSNRKPRTVGIGATSIRGYQLCGRHLVSETKTKGTRDKQKQSKTVKQTEGLEGKMACKQPKVLINTVDHFKFAKSE